MSSHPYDEASRADERAIFGWTIAAIMAVALLAVGL